MGKLWSECIECKDKCCKWDVAHPLFITEAEMKRICGMYPDKGNQMNAVVPCPFLTADEMCMIHHIKPVDCKLFPFDIIKVDGVFTWIIWQLDCLISRQEGDFEEYLQDIEGNIIPEFSEYLDDYAQFRRDELPLKYRFKVLRPLKFQSGMANQAVSVSTVGAHHIGL